MIRHLILLALTAVLMTGVAPAFADDLSPIALPPPQTTGGSPLLQALRERRTIREFETNDLPLQLLSNLLWAGFGVNRPETGDRTAPSAMNAQEIDIYVAMAAGLYRYNPIANRLDHCPGGDIRGKTSGQDFALKAPVTLLYVADYDRMTKAKPEQKEFYSGVDTGYISQNIYLFCASEHLGTVVHDLDRVRLASAMKLRQQQKIVLAQAVGFPKKAFLP